MVQEMGVDPYTVGTDLSTSHPVNLKWFWKSSEEAIEHLKEFYDSYIFLSEFPLHKGLNCPSYKKIIFLTSELVFCFSCPSASRVSLSGK